MIFQTIRRFFGLSDHACGLYGRCRRLRLEALWAVCGLSGDSCELSERFLEATWGSVGFLLGYLGSSLGRIGILLRFSRVALRPYWRHLLLLGLTEARYDKNAESFQLVNCN